MSDKRNVWTPEAIAMLGAQTDRDVARALGLGSSTVFYERTRRGIPTYRMGIIWDAEKIALLGTDTDSAVAALLSIKSAQVRRKRQELKIASATPNKEPTTIPLSYLEKLGKVSDGMIAKSLGYSQPAISKFRRDLGIAAIVAPTKPAPAEMDAELGLDSDGNIAKRHGVSRTCVWKRRKALGISAFGTESTSSVVDSPVGE